MRSTRRWTASAVAITLMFSAGCTDSNPSPAPTTSNTSVTASPSASTSSTAVAFPRWTADSNYRTYSEGTVSYLAGLAAELGKPVSPKKLTIKFFAAGEEAKEVSCGGDVYLNLQTSVPHIAFCGDGLMVFETGFKKANDENQIVSSFTWAIADAMSNGNEAGTKCFMGALSKIYANKETVLDVAASKMNLAYEGDADYTKGRQNGANACG